MDFKNKLDEIYKEAVNRLENFKSSHGKGTLNRMIEYMKEIGEALKEFAEKVAHKGSELIEKYPDKKEEIKKYISELKDKLVSTYKHK